MRSFAVPAFLLAALAGGAFAVAAAATGARGVDAASGALWSFVLALIIGLPVIASARRR